MKSCGHCGDILAENKWISVYKGLSFCSAKCLNAYQGKENEMSMSYRGYNTHLMMTITSPNGMKSTNIPFSLDDHHYKIAKRKIDEMLAVTCHQCKHFIKDGFLYLTLDYGTVKFCTIQCFENYAFDEDGELPLPVIKRLPRKGG